MNIGAIDLGILIAYLAGVVVFGVWMGRGARTAADYMLGGRDLPWWVILFSIVATETSTVTFLSIPGFAFEQNLTWLQLPLGFLIGRFVVASVLLPQYFKGTLFTSYQVLHRRFGQATSKAASALFIITRSLADGLRLFLSAIVLQEMTGLALHWAALAVGLTTILYTFFGGMRAVLWTDVVQFMIYMAGGVLALGLILRRLPEGLSQMISLGEVAGKFQVLDLTLSPAEPYALWAGLLGGIFVTLGSHGVDQLMVQRYLCARGLGEARRALTVSGFVVVGQFALFLIIGVALYAFYQVFPPAVTFERADRVFAHFIVTEVPVGLLGLLLGAVFAAAMSTLSSSLNSCATAVAKDFYFPLVGREVSPKRELTATRVFTVVFGLIQIGVAIAGQWVSSSVVGSVLGIASFTTGIVLGVFLLGILLPRAGEVAALSGLVVGLVAMTWIKFATPLAWPWFALVGSVITFGVGWVASFLWPVLPGAKETGK